MNGPDYLKPLQPHEVGGKLQELLGGDAPTSPVTFRKSDGTIISLERYGKEQTWLNVTLPSSSRTANFSIDSHGVITLVNPESAQHTGLNPYLMLKALSVDERDMSIKPQGTFGGKTFTSTLSQGSYNEKLTARLKHTHSELVHDVSEQVRWGHLDERYVRDYALHPLSGEALLEITTEASKLPDYANLEAVSLLEKELAAHVKQRLSSLDGRERVELQENYPEVNLELLQFATAHVEAEKIFRALLEPEVYEHLAHEIIELGFLPAPINAKRL